MNTPFQKKAFRTKDQSGGEAKEVETESVVHAEVEVGLVEDVDSDVTVLAAGSVAVAVRVEHDAVDGTEVTLHSSELLVFENLQQNDVAF